MKNLTPEMIEKAKSVKSAEELLEIAKANGVEMTADEAVTYFAQLNPKSGEISDDDLDNVAGGACKSSEERVCVGDTVRVTSGQTCPNCGGNEGTYIGDISSWSCDYIKCRNCGSKIAYTSDCTYEKIG